MEYDKENQWWIEYTKLSSGQTAVIMFSKYPRGKTLTTLLHSELLIKRRCCGTGYWKQVAEIYVQNALENVEQKD